MIVLDNPVSTTPGKPRVTRSFDPGIRAFRRRWSNPQVVVAFHAVKEP